MDTIILYAKFTILITIFISVPMIFTWSKGQIVGKRPPQMWISGLIVFLISSGVFVGLAAFCFQMAQRGTFLDWLIAAFVAGCGIASIVAIQEVKREEEGAKLLEPDNG